MATGTTQLGFESSGHPIADGAFGPAGRLADTLHQAAGQLDREGLLVLGNGVWF